MYAYVLAPHDLDTCGAQGHTFWEGARDVGKAFNGEVLTQEHYEEVREAYVSVLLAAFADITTAVVEPASRCSTDPCTVVDLPQLQLLLEAAFDQSDYWAFWGDNGTLAFRDEYHHLSLEQNLPLTVELEELLTARGFFVKVVPPLRRDPAVLGVATTTVSSLVLVEEENKDMALGILQHGPAISWIMLPGSNREFPPPMFPWVDWETSAHRALERATTPALEADPSSRLTDALPLLADVFSSTSRYDAQERRTLLLEKLRGDRVPVDLADAVLVSTLALDAFPELGRWGQWAALVLVRSLVTEAPSLAERVSSLAGGLLRRDVVVSGWTAEEVTCILEALRDDPTRVHELGNPLPLRATMAGEEHALLPAAALLASGDLVVRSAPSGATLHWRGGPWGSPLLELVLDAATGSITGLTVFLSRLDILPKRMPDELTATDGVPLFDVTNWPQDRYLDSERDITFLRSGQGELVVRLGEGAVTAHRLGDGIVAGLDSRGRLVQLRIGTETALQANSTSEGL